MSHNLSIHAPVGGYLGCFHSLAIMNNTAIHTTHKLRFGHTFSVLSGMFPGVGWLGGVRILRFLKASKKTWGASEEPGTADSQSGDDDAGAYPTGGSTLGLGSY